MASLKSRPGLALAGCYALISGLVIYMSSRSAENDFWNLASVVITLPWSVAVTLMAFMLIHISSNGIEYGLALCAVLNAIILYLLGRWFWKSEK